MTLINIDWTAVLIVVSSGVLGAMFVRGIAWHSDTQGERKARLAVRVNPK